MRKRFALFFFMVLSCTATVNAATIFSDDFDDCTVGCTVGSTAPNSANWMQWMLDGTSATHDSVTHYSGEITSPGRGGSGKSLKLWRHSTSWTGSASHAGALVLTAPSSLSNFYVRFYAKIPNEMVIPPDTKMWRFNTSGGEIYVNLNASGSGGKGDSFLWCWGGSGDSSINTTLVSAATLVTLWDGDWHCWELRFNLSTGTVTFWGDGSQLGSITDSRLQQGTWNSYMQHFPLGNAQQGNWQSSWQSFEVDDFSINTTYTGPDAGTAPIPSLHGVSLHGVDMP